MFFKVIKKHKYNKARLGLIKTAHGNIHTPSFYPVATKATVKGLTSDDIKSIGFEAILANTYHLYLQPGDKLIKKMGGLHKFMNYDGPIATDSGGFQVFSLGSGSEHSVGKLYKGEAEETKGKRKISKLVKVDNEGVSFRSHIDGSKHRFTPESSIKIQENLGSDIIFAFDECTSPLDSYEYTKQSMNRTHAWAKRCLKARKRKDQYLFGIVQGGLYEDLRQESAQFIGALPFDGFALGGSFGKGELKKTLDWVMPYLPDNKPRHLLGIGYLDDIKGAVKRGIDMFDCVQPTRIARHGAVLTNQGELNILNAKYKNDRKPIMAKCDCQVCQNYTRSYLHHLFKANEMLGPRLATYHNLSFMQKYFAQIRQDIKVDKRF